MMHVRIIQKLLKKLVQLRQKIDIPQLETNKPFLFLPYRAKINLKNKLASNKSEVYKKNSSQATTRIIRGYDKQLITKIRAFNKRRGCNKSRI